MSQLAVIPLSLLSACVITYLISIVASVVLAVSVIASARRMAASDDARVAAAGKRAKGKAVLALVLSPLLPPVALALGRSSAKLTAHSAFPDREEPNPEYEAMGADERARARRNKTQLPPRTVTVASDLTFRDRSRSKAFSAGVAAFVASLASVVAAMATTAFIAPDLAATAARLAGVELPEDVAAAVAPEAGPPANVDAIPPIDFVGEDGHVDREAFRAYVQDLGIDPAPYDALAPEDVDATARKLLELMGADPADIARIAGDDEPAEGQSPDASADASDGGTEPTPSTAN